MQNSLLELEIMHRQAELEQAELEQALAISLAIEEDRLRNLLHDSDFDSFESANISKINKMLSSDYDSMSLSKMNSVLNSSNSPRADAKVSNVLVALLLCYSIHMKPYYTHMTPYINYYELNSNTFQLISYFFLFLAFLYHTYCMTSAYYDICMCIHTYIG